MSESPYNAEVLRTDRQGLRRPLTDLRKDHPADGRVSRAGKAALYTVITSIITVELPVQPYLLLTNYGVAVVFTPTVAIAIAIGIGIKILAREVLGFEI